ncbi:MAG: serine hydrolase domain-containing protein [Rickettsiaceae bacterium]|nr:serine hydrolase domain-containing protein [Rickettsiaceae bacterium]
MKFKYPLVGIISILAISCGSESFIKFASGKISSFLDSHKDMTVAYQIDQGNEVIAHGSQGFFDRENSVKLEENQKMALASATKTMTAAIILKLQEKGMISVHDKLIKYFDESSGWWPENKAPEWANEVTIHHLLNHTSGIENYVPNLKFDPAIGFAKIKELVVEFAAKTPLAAKVGEKYHYSNTNYFFLGLVIEKITGHDLADVFQQEIFQPLEMKDSRLATFQEAIDYQDGKMPDYPKRYFVIPGGDNPSYMDAKLDFYVVSYADGGVVSTAQDLVKWNKALHNGKVLSDISYKQMITPYIEDDGDVLFGKTQVGYGIKIADIGGGKKIYYHSGMAIGVRSENGYSPSCDLSFALLSNVMPIQKDPKLQIDFSDSKNQLDIGFLRSEISSIIKNSSCK